MLRVIVAGSAWAILLASAGCREKRTAEVDASKAAATAEPVVAREPDWRGKALHAWTTSCDPASPEAEDVLARVGRKTIPYRSVGLACSAIREDGTVATEGTKEGRAKLVAKLRARAVIPSFVVANPGPGGFDGALGAKVVEDPERRARLVDGIADAVKNEGFRSVELDVEALPTHAREGYAALVRETIAKVGPDVEVSVDVHPKTVDDPGWDGPGAHDYAALAGTRAIVRLMTYDLSIGPVPPGPSTKASWIREVVAYARAKGIPASRLEIGLPAYGYDFPPSGAPIPLRHAEVTTILARAKATIARDELGTPHFAYADEAGRHEVWFDDGTSLSHVLGGLGDVARDVRGLAIWGVGRADPMLERALAYAGLRPR